MLSRNLLPRGAAIWGKWSGSIYLYTDRFESILSALLSGDTNHVICVGHVLVGSVREFSGMLLFRSGVVGFAATFSE